MWKRVETCGLGVETGGVSQRHEERGEDVWRWFGRVWRQAEMCDKGGKINRDDVEMGGDTDIQRRFVWDV